ncbi:MAG: hypothetical protein AAGI51_08125 [Pseudomonadota bacterium]
MNDVWPIRVRLEVADSTRDLALFNTATNSKLHGCDLIALRASDVFATGQVKERVSILQSPTSKPVRFELAVGTRLSLRRRLEHPLMVGQAHLWPGRSHERPHVSTRPCARLVRDRVALIGLEPSAPATQSVRRTKAAQIRRTTGNLRAIPLLLDRTTWESTVRYLGFEPKDAGDDGSRGDLKRFGPHVRGRPMAAARRRRDAASALPKTHHLRGGEGSMRMHVALVDAADLNGRDGVCKRAGA